MTLLVSGHCVCGEMMWKSYLIDMCDTLSAHRKLAVITHNRTCQMDRLMAQDGYYFQLDPATGVFPAELRVEYY